MRAPTLGSRRLALVMALLVAGCGGDDGAGSSPTTKNANLASTVGGTSSGSSDAPTDLTVTPAPATRLDLSWKDNSSDEDGFKIERSMNSIDFSQIATVGANVTQYGSTGLSASTKYYFRVRAYNLAGVSGYSNIAGATTGLAAGAPDTSLAGTGIVTTDLGSLYEEAHAIALQPDGKMVVVGSSMPPGGDYQHDFAVVRYNGDGTLDTSFNGTGIVITPVGSSYDVAAGVVLQPDGKIVVAGSSSNNYSYDFAVVRYNADGTLDTGFNGSGIVTTPIGPDNDRASAILLQPDGKIVVVGSYDTPLDGGITVVRYNGDGTLDVSFNGTGKVMTNLMTPVPGVENEFGNAALQSDGKIVVAVTFWSGDLDSPGNYDIAVVRYNGDGTLDTSFNGSGIVMTAVGPSHDRATAVAVQSDGKIVVAGGSENNNGNFDFAVVRYNGDGTLDTSFNGSGIVTTPVGPVDNHSSLGAAVILQPDGRIVVAGRTAYYAGTFIAVVRYKGDGTLDTSFNGTGVVVTTQVGPATWASDVALQPDGKIVVTGTYQTPGGASQDLIVVRYR